MKKLSKLSSNIALAAAAITLSLASQSASALVITGIDTTVGIGNTLTNALLAPSSGITVVGTSYQGVNTGSLQQSGLYTGLNLTPSTGSGPSFTMNDGIFLSSGNVNVVQPNSANETTVFTGSGGNAQLTTLAGNSTNDANMLTIQFTVSADIKSVAAQFMFGTEEFPTQTVTDIFGFFVDGVNYAKFSSGELISNTPGNPTNFTSNPVGADLYEIEYNGLTRVFNIVGLLGDGVNGVHTLSIGIADTSDSRFDSGVFVSSLVASTQGNGGIDPNEVPEPASLALVGLGLAGLAAVRRRKQA